MRIRKLLLVHPGRSTRALIKKYIFAELSDTDITETSGGEQALDQIGHQDFDVIISTEQLKDMELAAFKEQLAAARPNGLSSLIVISDSEADRHRDELIHAGFEHVVQIRICPSDLIKKINEVCDPRKWRKDARYHISNASVVIESPSRKMEAALINFSKGGVLVELTTADPSTLMNGGLSLALQIPIDQGVAVIDGLTTKLLRVETVAWTQGHLPKTMRATFIFVDLSSAAAGKLNELVQMAKDEKFAATEVTD